MRALAYFGLLSLLLGQADLARAAPRELTSEELDAVTAGGMSAELLDGVLHVQFSGTGGGMAVDGSGTIALAGAPLSGPVGAIVIHDQTDISSVVSVTAVNSAIQVLVNLNVNVNSVVGTVRQLNLSGLKLPALAAGF